MEASERQRRKNVRTGLILALIAAGFLFMFLLRRYLG
jgi:hypothetical protein